MMQKTHHGNYQSALSDLIARAERYQRLMFCNKLAALNQQNISSAVNQFADDWNR